MKKKKIPLRLLYVLLLCTLCSVAVSAERVSLTGNGTATVKAETARLHLAVRTEGKDERSAAEENRARTDALRKRLGEKSDISETGYYIATEPGGERVSVTRTLAVKTVAEKAKTLIGSLGDLLGTELYGVSYHAENTALAEETALKAAIEEAKKKAELLGVGGKTLSLRECESYLTDDGEELTLYTRVELLFGESDCEERPPAVRDTKEKKEG